MLREDAVELSDLLQSPASYLDAQVYLHGIISNLDERDLLSLITSYDSKGYSSSYVYLKHQGLYALVRPNVQLRIPGGILQPAYVKGTFTHSTCNSATYMITQIISLTIRNVECMP